MSWPVTKNIHLFDNVKLKAEWFDIRKAMSRSISNIDTSLLIGGRLDYSVKYTQGWPIAEDANIAFEGANIVSEALSKGETKSGSVDLTGLIGRDFKITISFPSAPGIWSEVSFDIWIILGFSSEPPIPPSTPPDWKNMLVLAVFGLSALLILTRPRTR